MILRRLRVFGLSFPYFPVMAAALARPMGHYRLTVDCFEVWSPEHWRGYVGPIGGRIGLAIQKLCARIPHVRMLLSSSPAPLNEQGSKQRPTRMRRMLHTVLARVPGTAGVRTGFVPSAPITSATPARLLAPVLSRDEASVCFAEEFRGVLDNTDSPKRLAPLFERRARAPLGRVRL